MKQFNQSYGNENKKIMVNLPDEAYSKIFYMFMEVFIKI